MRLLLRTVLWRSRSSSSVRSSRPGARRPIRPSTWSTTWCTPAHSHRDRRRRRVRRQPDRHVRARVRRVRRPAQPRPGRPHPLPRRGARGRGGPARHPLEPRRRERPTLSEGTQLDPPNWGLDRIDQRPPPARPQLHHPGHRGRGHDLRPRHRRRREPPAVRRPGALRREHRRRRVRRLRRPRHDRRGHRRGPGLRRGQGGADRVR